MGAVSKASSSRSRIADVIARRLVMPGRACRVGRLAGPVASLDNGDDRGESRARDGGRLREGLLGPVRLPAGAPPHPAPAVPGLPGGGGGPGAGNGLLLPPSGRTAGAPLPPAGRRRRRGGA